MLQQPCADAFCDHQDNVQQAWNCHYRGTHNASMSTLKEMKLETPIYIEPDDSVGVYVHSALAGDDAVVYDDQRHNESHKDMYLTITPGMAHLSNDAFSNQMQDGFWNGRPWRPGREFVGRISYGVRWLLWNPDVHAEMPPTFRKIAWSLLLSQTERAGTGGCLLSGCDLDTILFILNKVEWWEMDACQSELKARLRVQKRTRDDDGVPFDAPRGGSRFRGFYYHVDESEDDEEYSQIEVEEDSDDEQEEAEEDGDDESD